MNEKGHRSQIVGSSGQLERNSAACAGPSSLEKFRYRYQASADDKRFGHTVRVCSKLICHDMKIIDVKDRETNDGYNRNPDKPKNPAHGTPKG